MLGLARESIEYGLQKGGVLPVDPELYEGDLRENGACFVTLKRSGQLRGCIGSISAYQPLIMDVADKAHGAAFRDPRFPPLRKNEWPGLDLHISVLTPLQEMQFVSEADLLSKIRPLQDGLVLEDGRYKGTFLPVMWEQLPTAPEFLAHLKLKAGLTVDHWSPRIRVWRFQAESIKA